MTFDISNVSPTSLLDWWSSNFRNYKDVSSTDFIIFLQKHVYISKEHNAYCSKKPLDMKNILNWCMNLKNDCSAKNICLAMPSVI